MPDYPAMYRKLLASQADAIDGLKEIIDNLIQAHRQVEEILISAPEPDIVVLKRDESTINDSF